MRAPERVFVRWGEDDFTPLSAQRFRRHTDETEYVLASEYDLLLADRDILNDIRDMIGGE